jgi:hypothetical protein
MMQCLNGFKVAMLMPAFSCTPEELQHMTKVMENLRNAGCDVVPASDDDIDIVIHKEKPKTRSKNDGRLHVHESWIMRLPFDGTPVAFPDKEYLIYPADDDVIANFDAKIKEVHVLGLEALMKKYKAENEQMAAELAEVRKMKRGRASDTDSETKRCRQLRADLPQDVKDALVDCYAQCQRGDTVPASEPGDTAESAQRLVGNSRLYRFYKASPTIRRFFGASFPNSETFRKNYNHAVAALYHSGNPNQPRAESECSDLSVI